MTRSFEQSKTDQNSITLCICTMNRPDDLNRCLASVFHSNEMPDEIIVSDDSPDGRPTQTIVFKYPKVIYQEGPHRGLGPNRNACIQRAKSSHLIFIDDDVRLPPNFLATAKQLIATFNSKTVITGHEMNYGGGGRWTGEVRKIVPQNPDFWGFQQVPVSSDYGAIVINATIFPRCLFEQALFDECLRYGSEEIDMAQHALALGYRIVYQDELFAEHYPSLVNREKYEKFIHASRMYVTAKSYWLYERSPLKTLAYILLAPLHMTGHALCQRNLSALFKTFQSTFLASRYLWSGLTKITPVSTTVSRVEQNQPLILKRGSLMSSKKFKILVTGGAGYIGSHAVLALQRRGYEVIVLDNLVYGHRDIVENVLQSELIIGDISDRLLLDQLFARHDIAAVMHFAAYAYVGESTVSPGKYYRNNVVGTLTLLEAMLAASVDQFVFSSTCATYGQAQTIPISETHPQEPINPYGASKLMLERILQDFDLAYGLKSVTFRYFNAAGADPEGLIGEDHTPETHLLPLVLLTALGQRDSINIFGTDYPTADGTCIRDYIHVTDLAQAHVLGLEYLLKGGETETFNLGNGNGFSVKEVIETAEQVTGRKIPVVESPRRPGDPPVLVGSSEKAQKILDWRPQYANLAQILGHAWQWHQQRHPQTTTLREVLSV